MKREDVIKDLIQYDLDCIWETGAETCVEEMLRKGVKGYEELPNEVLEESYNEIFKDNEDDEPIIIEED